MKRTDDTINDLLTQGRGEAVILAGRFKIIRKLGEGGMGSVWLAEDRKLDGRKVAIKMLPVVLATNARAIGQLKAEAKVAMQLSHSNIVTLRSFEDSDEGAFLVMDYVPGKTLEKILEEKETLTEDEVLKIFRPIAEALDYAHRHKVVHRDVKPSNVMIREDGEPFIMDFGIAREMKDTLTRATGRDSSGSLPWMSPEQLRGEDPAPAQDIYSLAATIYECLSGHPPFYRGDIRYQIPQVAPTPLTSKSPLATAVMAGLAKDPSRRSMVATALLDPGVQYAFTAPVAAFIPTSRCGPGFKSSDSVVKPKSASAAPPGSPKNSVRHFPGIACVLAGILLGALIGVVADDPDNIIVGSILLGAIAAVALWMSRSILYAFGSSGGGAIIILLTAGEIIRRYADYFIIWAISLALVPALALWIFLWAWRRDRTTIRPLQTHEPAQAMKGLSLKSIYIRILFGTPILFPAYLIYTIGAWIVWVFLGGWIYLAMGKKPKHEVDSIAYLVFWPIFNPLYCALINLGSIIWAPFVWGYLYYFKDSGMATDIHKSKNIFTAPFLRAFSIMCFDSDEGNSLENI